MKNIIRKKLSCYIIFLLLLVTIITLPFIYGKYRDTFRKTITVNVNKPQYTVYFTKNDGSLPAGYQKIDYVESTGTQYIDTGVCMTTSRSFEIQFQFTDWVHATTGGTILVGSYDGSINANALSVWKSYFATHTNQYISFMAADANIHVVKWNRTTRKASIDNRTPVNIAPAGTSRTPWLLFGSMYPQGPSYLSSARVYYMKIYNSSTLIRDFVPSIRENDEVAGLYDSVNNVFYPSLSGTELIPGTLSQHFVYGTGQNLTANQYSRTGYRFVGWNTKSDGSGTSYTDEELVNNLTSVDGGKIILYAQWESTDEYDVEFSPNFNNLPDQYAELEYIEGTGTQYIDTNFQPNQDTRLVMDFLQSGGSKQVGTEWRSSEAGTSSANYAFRFGKNSSGNWYVGYGTQGLASVGTSDSNRHLLDFNKNNIYLDNTLIKTYSYETFTGYGNINLLNISTNYASLTSPTKSKLYSTKIYDNSVLIRDFVPSYRISDGIAGLYDTVNDVFYVNAHSSDDNFGTGIESQHFTVGVSQNLISNPYTRSGYSFAGWNTAADGSGASYSDMQSVTNLSTIDGDVVVLYALWTAN